MQNTSADSSTRLPLLTSNSFDSKTRRLCSSGTDGKISCNMNSGYTMSAEAAKLLVTLRQSPLPLTTPPFRDYMNHIQVKMIFIYLLLYKKNVKEFI